MLPEFWSKYVCSCCPQFLHTSSFKNHFGTFYFSYRINLPKRKRRDCFKDSEKEHEAEHDLDAASEASSEPDYNYEFAQMEVIMKMLNSNGEKMCSGMLKSDRFLGCLDI